MLDGNRGYREPLHYSNRDSHQENGLTEEIRVAEAFGEAFYRRARVCSGKTSNSWKKNGALILRQASTHHVPPTEACSLKELTCPPHHTHCRLVRSTRVME